MVGGAGPLRHWLIAISRGHVRVGRSGARRMKGGSCISRFADSRAPFPVAVARIIQIFFDDASFTSTPRPRNPLLPTTAHRHRHTSPCRPSGMPSQAATTSRNSSSPSPNLPQPSAPSPSSRRPPHPPTSTLPKAKASSPSSERLPSPTPRNSTLSSPQPLYFSIYKERCNWFPVASTFS